MNSHSFLFSNFILYCPQGCTELLFDLQRKGENTIIIIVENMIHPQANSDIVLIYVMYDYNIYYSL